MRIKFFTLFILTFMVSILKADISKIYIAKDDFIQIKATYTYQDSLNDNYNINCEITNISNDTLYINYYLYNEENYYHNLKNYNMSFIDTIYRYMAPVVMEDLFTFYPNDTKKITITCEYENDKDKDKEINLPYAYLLGFDYLIDYNDYLTNQANAIEKDRISFYFDEEQDLYNFIGFADTYCYKILYITIDFNLKYKIGKY